MPLGVMYKTIDLDFTSPCTVVIVLITLYVTLCVPPDIKIVAELMVLMLFVWTTPAVSAHVLDEIVSPVSNHAA